MELQVQSSDGTSGTSQVLQVQVELAEQTVLQVQVGQQVLQVQQELAVLQE